MKMELMKTGLRMRELMKMDVPIEDGVNEEGCNVDGVSEEGVKEEGVN